MIQLDLEYLKQRAIYYNCAEISSIIIDDPKFSVCSGSVDNKHHFGFGGLLRHTAEVVELVELNGELLGKMGYIINHKVLFLAALFHDYGKIWDYTPTAYSDYKHWEGTLHKREVHHISRSAIEWSKAVDKTNQCRDIEDAVLHCILSHHGTREWGSPVMPHSREAWILHLCDSLSARANDCNKIDLAGK